MEKSIFSQPVASAAGLGRCNENKCNLIHRALAALCNMPVQVACSMKQLRWVLPQRASCRSWRLSALEPCTSTGPSNRQPHSAVCWSRRGATSALRGRREAAPTATALHVSDAAAVPAWAPGRGVHQLHSRQLAARPSFSRQTSSRRPRSRNGNHARPASIYTGVTPCASCSQIEKDKELLATHMLLHALFASTV